MTMSKTTTQIQLTIMASSSTSVEARGSSATQPPRSAASTEATGSVEEDAPTMAKPIATAATAAAVTATATATATGGGTGRWRSRSLSDSTGKLSLEMLDHLATASQQCLQCCKKIRTMSPHVLQPSIASLLRNVALTVVTVRPKTRPSTLRLAPRLQVAHKRHPHPRFTDRSHLGCVL